MKMRSAPYETGRLFDRFTEQLMKGMGDKLDTSDDDNLIVCTGTAGTGKSSLMLHSYESYAGGAACIDAIGLNRKDHALSLAYARDQPRLRFCGFDEANVNRRNAMTTENKDLLGLYYSIRGLRIFHWWNNPSIEMLDKPFIEERIKGVIFIATKDKLRPRVFYYFTKQGLLSLLEKQGNLKHRTLKKFAKDYAFYKGWFKKYDGRLYKDYLAKKQGHMSNYVDEYIEKYASEDVKTQAEVAKEFGVSPNTIKNWHEKLEGQGNLVEDKHFVRNAAGHRKYYQEGIDILRNHSFDDQNMGGGLA
jgi:hypothetical protein